MTAIKAFVVYNLTVVFFALSHKNSSKPSRSISNNINPYIQAELFTEQNNHKTIGYLSMRRIETDECEAPYSCLPKKYSDRVNDILGQQKHQHF